MTVRILIVLATLSFGACAGNGGALPPAFDGMWLQPGQARITRSVDRYRCTHGPLIVDPGPGRTAYVRCLP